MVEQRTCNALVVGSNPIIGSIGTWPSLVRLLIWVQESASSNLVVPTIVYNAIV